MKKTLNSPWAALALGIALTIVLYALAVRLIPHGTR